MSLKFWKRSSSSETAKPKAVIFIDHDHWYISLKKQYRVESNIKTLFNSINTKYDTLDTFAFGDFTAADNKLGDFAGVTENLFDVRGDAKNDKDILMLDMLYRTGIQYKNTGVTVIIVSGSGRLTLAARFLKEECGLKIEIYSIRGCLSGALKETADCVSELPNEEFISMLFPLIINNCVHVSRTSNIIPTFKTTIEAVSSYNDVSPVLVEEAVCKMLELGYLYQSQTVLSSFNTVKTIAANWEQLIQDGLYNPENE